MKFKTILMILLLALVMPAANLYAAKPKELSIQKIISAADKLMRKQSLMSWNNRIKGTAVNYQATYKGYEWLFTKEAIAFVDKAMREAKISDDERRNRSLLRDYLVMQYIGQQIVSFDDRITNTESSAKVYVPWLKKEVAYREISTVMAKEDDAKKRKELQSLSAKIQREELNPIITERDAKTHELIKELGYKTYLDFSLEARHVKNFRKIIDEADSFNMRTDGIYKKLLAEHAKELLGLQVNQMRRSDMQKIFRFDPYVPYFPAEITVAFLKHFLEGIGLDLTTADGHKIFLDDKPRPKKNPRAACYNITVPSDVRMTIAPQGGLGDFGYLFHETGHAEHFANTTVPEWSFKYLGDYAATESYASLFESRLAEPEFLKMYRDFVIAWNKSEKTQIPVLTDKDIAKVVRFGILNDLYFMRRYGGAKLVYESIYHGNDPKWRSGIYNGQTKNKKELYRTLFQKAYGFPMEEADAERYLTDIDEFLYAVDYVRSFVVGSQINFRLSQLFGKKWFGNKNVGEYLKKNLFFAGDKLTADEVVTRLGFNTIDFHAYERDIRARLAESGHAPH